MKLNKAAQMFSLEAIDAHDALIHGYQEKKVRFQQFARTASLLTGKGQRGKRRIATKGKKKISPKHSRVVDLNSHML